MGYTDNLLTTVNWPAVHPLLLICSILDLQPGLDVFNRRCNKANCASSQYPGNTMPKTRQRVGIRAFAERNGLAYAGVRKHIFEEQTLIERERT